MKKLLIASVIACFSTGAFAHSPLQGTSPKDGAALSAPPEHVSFSFKRNIRLTRVTATATDGETAVLNLTGQKKFATNFSLKFLPTAKSEYTIEWRGLGDDGHAQKGSFTFTVN